MQALAPELHAIVSDASGDSIHLKRMALSIMNHLIAGLGALSGAHQKQVRDMMLPLLQPWTHSVCQILAADFSIAVSI